MNFIHGINRTLNFTGLQRPNNPWPPFENGDTIRLQNGYHLKVESPNIKYLEKWNRSYLKGKMVRLYHNTKLVFNEYCVIPMLNMSYLSNRTIILHKQVEALYTRDIAQKPEDQRHLKSIPVIFDTHHGILKEESDGANIYLIKNSIFYTIYNTLYDLFNNKSYKYQKIMQSEGYIFITSKMDPENTKYQVIQIQKQTGETQIFK